MPSISTSASTIASAISPRLPVFSAVARISVRKYDRYFSLTGLPLPEISICIGVAAPMLAPGLMTICVAANEMSAPAEMARLLMNAMVGTFVFKSASRICIAESTRPPSVLISKIIASACAFSRSTRSIYGAKPRSIIPEISIFTTRFGAACAGNAAKTRPRTATMPQRNLPVFLIIFPSIFEFQPRRRDIFFRLPHDVTPSAFNGLGNASLLSSWPSFGVKKLRTASHELFNVFALKGKIRRNENSSTFYLQERHHLEFLGGRLGAARKKDTLQAHIWGLKRVDWLG